MQFKIHKFNANYVYRLFVFKPFTYADKLGEGISTLIHLIKYGFPFNVNKIPRYVVVFLFEILKLGTSYFNSINSKKKLNSKNNQMQLRIL